MRRDHERAFDAFVSSTHERAYRTAFAVTRAEAPAKAALQDAYGDAYAQWGQLRLSEHPESGLRRFLVGRLLKQPAEVLPPNPRAAAPDEQMVDCDTVWSAMRELPREHRVMLALRHYERMNDAEIAACSGIAVESVRTRLAEAMTALRQVLVAPARPRQRV